MSQGQADGVCRAAVPVAPSVPPRNRLREQVLFSGCSTLSEGDLLALLAGSQGYRISAGLIRDLLDRYDGLVGLADLHTDELMRSGLPPGASARVAAAFELGRRLSQARRRQRPSMKTPEAIVAALGTSLATLPHEELWMLPLDPQSRLICEPRIVSRGDVDGTDAGPRAFFRVALAAGATSAIAVHNHPSGETTPSSSDFEVTKRLALAGASVDLALLDHVVLGVGGCFTSIRRIRPELFR